MGDDLTHRFTIRLDDELEAALRRAAKKRKVQSASIMREALHKFLLATDEEYRAAHEAEMSEGPKPGDAVREKLEALERALKEAKDALEK